MIRRPAGGQHRNSMIVSDSGKVSREFRQHFPRNEITPLFRAEDTMDKNVGIPVSHSPTYPRRRAFVCAGHHFRRAAVPKRDSVQGLSPNPALACRALTFRACGTYPSRTLAKARASTRRSAILFPRPNHSGLGKEPRVTAVW